LTVKRADKLIVQITKQNFGTVLQLKILKIFILKLYFIIMNVETIYRNRKYIFF
jgi:hypothetical protein